MKALVWSMATLMAVFVAMQLYYGRVVVGHMRTMGRSENEGRFWFFIAGYSLAVPVLVGFAIFGTP